MPRHRQLLDARSFRVGAAWLSCCVWASAPFISIAPLYGQNAPAAPAPTKPDSETLSGTLRVSLPSGMTVDRGLVVAFVDGQLIEIPIKGHGEGEAIGELPSAALRRADGTLIDELPINLQPPWELTPVENEYTARLVGLGILGSESIAEWRQFRAVLRKRFDRGHGAVARVPLTYQGSHAEGSIQIVREVRLHGQVDNGGDTAKWAWRWGMLPGYTSVPTLGPSGDFRFWIHEGVENTLLAMYADNRLVDVRLGPWREGDRGVHLKFPKTPDEELVRADTLRIFDAGIDRVKGGHSRKVESGSPSCTVLLFVSPDGQTMYRWEPPATDFVVARLASDAEGDGIPHVGQLGLTCLRKTLYRWKIGIGTWWVFDTYPDVGLNMNDFWTCLDALRDGFDLEGFGMTKLVVTKEAPTEDRIFDAVSIRKGQAAAAAWVRACRKADAAGTPRPAKPVEVVEPALKPDSKPEPRP